MCEDPWSERYVVSHSPLRAKPNHRTPSSWFRSVARASRLRMFCRPGSTVAPWQCAWKLAKEFNVEGRLPLVWFLMRCPFELFEIWRHAALASVLGMPKVSVGFGYEYLTRGERPDEKAEQFESV